MTSPATPHASASPPTDTRNTLQDLDRATTRAFAELERVLPDLHAVALRAQGNGALAAARMVRDAEYLLALLKEANRLADGCRVLYRNVACPPTEESLASSPADRTDLPRGRCQP